MIAKAFVSFLIQGWLRLIGEFPFSNCDSSLWLHLNLSKQFGYQIWLLTESAHPQEPTNQNWQMQNCQANKGITNGDSTDDENNQVSVSL